MKKKITFVPAITVPSLTVIIGTALLAGFFPKTLIHVLNQIKLWIFNEMSWFFVMSISVFIIFLIFLAASKYGSIRLGADDSQPEYSFFSWMAMLFSAGLGIGLMFFGVAEPLQHFNSPQIQALGITEASRAAQMYTFFHWGIHAWAVYAIVGLALGYFAYRYKLPLSLRSAFYPLFKQKIYGWRGHLIDIFALCSTFFGLSASLGYGVLQLNSGLVSVGAVHSNTYWTQVIIVSIVMLIAISSAISGIGKGVKMLSQFNVTIAILLMVFVLLAGPTIYILGTFSDGLGNYFSHFMKLTFDTHTSEPTWHSWFNNWTILYWAWWISWSPYVGLFIAKISKGRTIREFIVAVLLVPSLFIFLWMTVFGNTAIHLDATVLDGALSKLIGTPEILLFSFLANLPWTFLTSLFAILIIIIFYITSADSGIYVMNNISSMDHKNSPQWQKAFWGVLMGVVALVLLRIGGTDSLMAMTLISALPFTFVMLIYCWCLIKALSQDSRYYSRGFAVSTRNWGGDSWKEQLDRILTFRQRKDVRAFLENKVRPAFEELASEFEKKEISAHLSYTKSPRVRISISIPYENMKDFVYGVKALPQDVSELLLNEDNAPNVEDDKVYTPFTFFTDGRRGYDIQYFSKEEIINDVLKQYERYISLAQNQENHLFVLD